MEYIYENEDYIRQIQEMKDFRDIGDCFYYIGVKLCVLSHKNYYNPRYMSSGTWATLMTDYTKAYVTPLLTAEYFCNGEYKTKSFTYEMLNTLKKHNS